MRLCELNFITNLHDTNSLADCNILRYIKSGYFEVSSTSYVFVQHSEKRKLKEAIRNIHGFE